MGEHYSQIDFAERRRIQDMRDAKMLLAAITEALDVIVRPSTGKSDAKSNITSLQERRSPHHILIANVWRLRRWGG